MIVSHIKDSRHFITAMTTRALTELEYDVVVKLADIARLDDTILSALETARVVDMSDGGMGSFRFEYGDSNQKPTARHSVTVEANDVDGVSLSIALFLDSEGRPLEVDIWKVDFSPLIQLPRPEALKRVS